jgi:hypothetical protein
MQCVYKKLSLLLVILLVAIVARPSIGYDDMDTIEQFKNVFYPAPFPIGTGGGIGYKTDPWTFFKVSGGLHVRDIRTGELTRVITLGENDLFAGNDDDSVYILHDLKDENIDDTFVNINLSDGTESNYRLKAWNSIKSTPGQSYTFTYYAKEIYQIVYSTDTFLKTSMTKVYCTNGKSWTLEGNPKDYFFLQAGNDLFKRGLLFVSEISDGKSFARFVNIEDGTTYARLEGQYEIAYRSNLQSPLVFMTLVSDDNKKVFRQTCVFNIETKQMIFTCEKGKEVASIDFVGDHVWISSINDFQRNNYIFGQTGPITLSRYEKDGTISRKIKIEPKLTNIPIDNFIVLNDSIIQLRVRNKLILWNYESDNLLLDSPVYDPTTFFFENNIYCVCYDKMFALDPQTMSVTWSLSFTKEIDVKVLEKKDHIYLLKRFYSTEKNKDGLIVKIINKADNSLEPYEYFVSPFYGDDNDIYDSPYGLVFISNYNICSFAVGGVQRFSIRDLYGIQSWKALDDPRYLEIKYQYDRTYRLDTKNGAFVLISTDGQ